MLPTVAGCVPYAGTQRLSYDFFKSCYLGRRGAKGGGGDEVLRTPPVAVSFGCGLLSSCLAMTVSYPFILVRTRLQVPSRIPPPFPRQAALSPSPSASRR